MTSYKETVRYAKTITIELHVESCRVTRFKLTGDFFIIPEELLDRVEESVVNCSSVDCILNALFELKRSIVIGFSVEDLGSRIVDAYIKLCRDEKYSR